MQRGHLVAYDNKGHAYCIGCEAIGDILPHDAHNEPLKVVELPYGALEGVKTWHIENDQLIIDELMGEVLTVEGLAAENEALKRTILEAEGVI